MKEIGWYDVGTLERKKGKGRKKSTEALVGTVVYGDQGVVWSCHLCYSHHAGSP